MAVIPVDPLAVLFFKQCSQFVQHNVLVLIQDEGIGSAKEILFHRHEKEP